MNLDQITRDIEALTESYPFEIPGYFALILRCFSVLGAPPVQSFTHGPSYTCACCTPLAACVQRLGFRIRATKANLGLRCRGDRTAGGPQLQHRAGVLPVPGAAAAAGQRPPHPGALQWMGCNAELASTGHPTPCWLEHASSLKPLCVLQTALRATLYGNKTRIDVARLQRLASGFSRFTVDGLPGSAAAVPPAQVHTVPAANASASHRCCPLYIMLYITYACSDWGEHLSILFFVCAAAANGGRCASPAPAAARQERAGGAAAGVCAAGQLRGRAVCRGAGARLHPRAHLPCRLVAQADVTAGCRSWASLARQLQHSLVVTACLRLACADRLPDMTCAGGGGGGGRAGPLRRLRGVPAGAGQRARRPGALPARAAAAGARHGAPRPRLLLRVPRQVRPPPCPVRTREQRPL